MFSYHYVFIIQNEKNEIVGVFKKKSNAIDSMPDNKKNFPKQLMAGSWNYGEDDKWKLTEIKIRDSNDLTSLK